MHGSASPNTLRLRAEFRASRQHLGSQRSPQQQRWVFKVSYLLHERQPVCFALLPLRRHDHHISNVVTECHASSRAVSHVVRKCQPANALSPADLWNQFVGPVSIAATNTTVQPTAVPTSELIPPPPLYYSPFPTGQQVAATMKNESWSWPEGFYWGVASAAYQAEGAVADEGRGPSIWDVLTHRVTDFVSDNSTGDVGKRGLRIPWSC